MESEADGERGRQREEGWRRAETVALRRASVGRVR
jgi:hypothetical protein